MDAAEEAVCRAIDRRMWDMWAHDHLTVLRSPMLYWVGRLTIRRVWTDVVQ